MKKLTYLILTFLFLMMGALSLSAYEEELDSARNDMERADSSLEADKTIVTDPQQLLEEVRDDIAEILCGLRCDRQYKACLKEANTGADFELCDAEHELCEDDCEDDSSDSDWWYGD